MFGLTLERDGPKTSSHRVENEQTPCNLNLSTNNLYTPRLCWRAVEINRDDVVIYKVQKNRILCIARLFTVETTRPYGQDNGTRKIPF